MKKATRLEEQSRPRKANDTTKPTTKIASVLLYLMQGNSLNRFAQLVVILGLALIVWESLL